MQFKLLNFHKMLANFAVNIIAVFVPLILYSYASNVLHYSSAGSLMLSFGYILLQYTLRIVFTTIFRKHIERRPQLFLLIRIVPMLGYALSVLLLDVNFWLAAVLILLCGGLSDSFSTFSNEVILNYSSLNKGGKSFGLTRFFEQVGIILSVLMGGVLLDRLDKSVVIIISVIIYSISVAPLVYYYIKFRKRADFNKEAISNAFLSMGQKQENNKRIKAVSKKILTYYFTLYLLMCFIDSLVNIYNLYAFTKTGGTYTYASLISASFNGAFGLASYVVGKLNEKIDMTAMCTVSGLVMAGLVVAIPFISNPIAVVAIFTIIGGLYPISSIFLIERMLTKTRILGISNQSLFNRERAVSLGKIGGFVLAIALPYAPAIVLIGVMFGAYSSLIPSVEEKTRKILVRFLEGSY